MQLLRQATRDVLVHPGYAQPHAALVELLSSGPGGLEPCLWVAQHCLLRVPEVQQLVRHLQHWLATERLEIHEPVPDLPRRLYAQRVHGYAQIRWLTNRLLGASQWFQVEPLPDDQYELLVKAENRDWLQHLATEYRVSNNPAEPAEVVHDQDA